MHKQNQKKGGDFLYKIGKRDEGRTPELYGVRPQSDFEERNHVCHMSLVIFEFFAILPHHVSLLHLASNP